MRHAREGETPSLQRTATLEANASDRLFCGFSYGAAS